MQNRPCRRFIPQPRIWLVVALLIESSLNANGAGARQRPVESPADVPTFRATTSLLTIDAVVTDREGHHVTDLTADDFEVTHGGRRVSLQHSVYVDTRTATPGAQDDQRPGSEPASAAIAAESPAPLTRELTTERRLPTRTIAFVVDDLGISFRGMYEVRRALQRYVDTQMEPGDLVAIVRTSGGVGALQQFTTDRRLLKSAIERLQWTPISRGNIAGFAPVTPDVGVGSADTGVGEIRDRILATGSLGSIQFIATGIQQLPGRKSLVLFSEGFGDLFTDRGESGQIWRAMARMLDRANRAGVVIYTVNAAGLQTGGLTAEDNPLPLPPLGGVPSLDARRAIFDRAGARRNTLLSSEEALRFVAQQTGGLSVLHNNDLNAGIRKALEDQRGYYLLGYSAPEGADTHGWEQDRVKVGVKRKGLRVRARQGFFGPADPEAQQNDFSADPLLHAALSPFAGGGIELRLTSLFAHDENKGSYVRSLLFIDPNSVRFTRGAEGRHDTHVEILQAAVGENGMIVAQWRRTLTLSVTDDQLDEIKREGIAYSARMSIEKAGAYQIRTAVRDVGTSVIGSASQFVEVPKVGKGRLAVSGVLLQAKTNGATSVETAAAQLEHGEEVRAVETVLGRPTLRIFKPGSEIVYAYEVYDGLSSDTAESLQMSTTLVREGRIVYRGPSEPLRAAKTDKDVRIIPIAGKMSLGHDVPPGTYTLQVHVGTGEKRRATQWADLEVRR